MRADRRVGGDEDGLHAELDKRAALQVGILREAARFRKLFESSPTAYLTTNEQGKILGANNAAATLFQLEPQFLTGKPLMNYVAGQERRAFRLWLIELRRRDAPASVSVRMQRRHGIAFDAHVTAIPADDEILWAIADITAQRQSEEAVWQLHRELDARVTLEVGWLRSVFDALPVGVAIMDAATREVRTTNRRAQEILDDRWGGELPVLPAASGADNRDPWRLDPVFAGDETPLRVVRVRAGSTNVLLELRAFPIHDDAGNVVAAALCFDDVTERDRREHAEAQFVENAAHQLRTPITAIAIAAAALEAGAKDEPHERERFLAHIARESERIGRVIDALLGLARVQRRGGGLLIGLVPVLPLLEEIVADTNVRAGVHVELDCPEDVAFVGDGGILREAFANVVRNAATHAAESIHITARVDGAQTVIDVGDDGPGVADELREQIFERFVRAPGASGRGAGLGLAIAAEAVEANRGTLVLCDGDSPGGTTFRFTLPGARLL